MVLPSFLVSRAFRMAPAAAAGSSGPGGSALRPARAARRRRSSRVSGDPAAKITPPGIIETPRRCAHAAREALLRSGSFPEAGVPYASWSSATSLISIPTTTSVSATTSAGKAGRTGSTDATPAAPPAAADARAASSISAAAISSGVLPGYCACSASWFRTRRRGGRAGRALDQRVGDLVGRLAGELRLQRLLVPDPQPRRHRDHLSDQVA